MSNIKSKITIRSATADDIEQILDIETERYTEQYSEDPQKSIEFKKRVERRLHNTRWAYVAVINQQVVGFLSAMETKKSPADFVSWEETTNFGTLDDVVDEGAKNLYVVNLDVGIRWTKHNAQYHLMSALGVDAIRHDKDIIFFESRMPMFRDWVDKNVKDWASLPDTKKLEIATDYVAITKDDGSRYDRLINFYHKNGFNIGNVKPNAFSDEESKNYGVVCYTSNPVPRFFRTTITNMLLSMIIGKMIKHPRLMKVILR